MRKLISFPAIGLGSELAAAGRDFVQSIDINPFICLEQGGKAVDAVIITRAGVELEHKNFVAEP